VRHGDGDGVAFERVERQLDAQRLQQLGRKAAERKHVAIRLKPSLGGVDRLYPPVLMDQAFDVNVVEELDTAFRQIGRQFRAELEAVAGGVGGETEAALDGHLAVLEAGFNAQQLVAFKHFPGDAELVQGGGGQASQGQFLVGLENLQDAAAVE